MDIISETLISALKDLQDAERAYKREIKSLTFRLGEKEEDFGEAGCRWLEDGIQKLFELIAFKAVEKSFSKDFLKDLKARLDMRLQK